MTWLERLLHDAVVVELRHEDGGQWRSGTFSRLAPLMVTAAKLSSCGNLYTSLNRPSIAATNAMTGRALRDADMAVRVRLPFDFDPLRPTGLPSTDFELEAAAGSARRLRAALSGLGWPSPATGMSGNGAHLVYRCQIPCTAELAELLGIVYAGLHADFDDPRVTFDRTVRNAARVWRLYGYPNRKGEETLGRPHRVAHVEIPAHWEPVSMRQIEHLARSYARRTEPAAADRRPPRPAVNGAGALATLDVVAWFTAHGGYRRQVGPDKHAVDCPFAGEHSTPSHPMASDTVVWTARGALWPSFHCSHAHCAGRGIRDVLALWGDADRFCARPWQRRLERLTP